MSVAQPSCPVVFRQPCDVPPRDEVEHGEARVVVEDKQGRTHHGTLSFQVSVVHRRIEPHEALEYLVCLLQPALLVTELHHVHAHPEHGYRRVVSLVCGIHRQYGGVCLLRPSLFPKFKDVSYLHIIQNKENRP